MCIIKVTITEVMHMLLRNTASNKDEVALALKKWHEAISYFESVKDPDLIDFAIYDMEAAKRRYVFLLKRVSHAKPDIKALEDKNEHTIQHTSLRSRAADTLDTV